MRILRPTARSYGAAAGCLLGCSMWGAYELLIEPATVLPVELLAQLTLGLTFFVASWTIASSGVICSTLFRAVVLGVVSCGVLMFLQADLAGAQFSVRIVQAAIGAGFGGSVAGLSKAVALAYEPRFGSEPGL